MPATFNVPTAGLSGEMMLIPVSGVPVMLRVSPCALVLYAMFDGGYRPDRSFNKCARVVGEVMGQYHPHGDTAIYDTLVRLAQPWVMRAPLINGQGNFGSPGNDSAAAMRYTECRMSRTISMASGAIRHSV